MGRVKLPMKMIELPTSRKVTFSKRRTGLMKKAFELSTLCAVDVAVLIIGPSNKFFQYCNGSLEDMIIRYALLTPEDRDKSLHEMRSKLLSFRITLGMPAAGDVEDMSQNRQIYPEWVTEAVLRNIASSSNQLVNSGSSKSLEPNVSGGSQYNVQDPNLYITLLEGQVRTRQAEFEKVLFHSKIFHGDPDVLKHLDVADLSRIERQLTASLDRVRQGLRNLISMQQDCHDLVPYQPIQHDLVTMHRQNPQVVGQLQSEIGMQGPFYGASCSNSVGPSWVNQRPARDDTSAPAAQHDNNYNAGACNVASSSNSAAAWDQYQRPAWDATFNLPPAPQDNNAQLIMHNVQAPQTPTMQFDQFAGTTQITRDSLLNTVGASGHEDTWLEFELTQPPGDYGQQQVGTHFLQAPDYGGPAACVDPASTWINDFQANG